MRRLALTVEVIAAYANVRWRLWRSGLPVTVAAIRAGRGERRWREPSRESHRLGRRLANATERTLALLPTDSRCLMRSLVLVRLLSRRGVHSTLIVGAKPAEPALRAHAWVEHGGRALLPTGDYEPLVEL